MLGNAIKSKTLYLTATAGADSLQPNIQAAFQPFFTVHSTSASGEILRLFPRPEKART